MNLTDYTLAPDATLLDAVAKINRNRSRTVLIVEAGKLTGLISEGDVLRGLLRGVDTHAPAREVANRSFRFLTEADHAAAFRLFQEHAFGLVPVVDDDFRLVGVITLEETLARATLPVDQ